MIGRVNTGGVTGATLTVNAPAGATVTVTKDGKTKTKTAGADGVAVFKGLATGQWTVTITDGVQTAQKTVTITADYSSAITFFAATIHVTYPAGSTCTATDGVTTMTAPDTSGVWDCVVPNAGMWRLRLNGFDWETVKITEEGQTKSVEVGYFYRPGWTRQKILKRCELTEPPSNAYSYDNDGIHIVNNGTSQSFGFCMTCRTIDLTKFSRLCIRASCYSAHSYYPDFNYFVARTVNPDMEARSSDIVNNRTVYLKFNESITSDTYAEFATEWGSGVIHECWVE